MRHDWFLHDDRCETCATQRAFRRDLRRRWGWWRMRWLPGSR